MKYSFDHIFFCIIISFLPLPLFSSEADTAYSQGVEALRTAQSDASNLTSAIKLLAKAAALYEIEDNEIKATEVNACLYWAKKRMTLADIETLKDSGKSASKRLEEISKPVEVSEAQKWLERADTFAKSRDSDPLLVAIHYFEVADRFKDSDAGRKAMGLSLGAMGRIKAVPEKVQAPAQVPAKAADKSKPFDPSSPDYDHLTAAQWDSVNGYPLKIVAKHILDTKIDVTKGQQYVLIPHPDDRWWCLWLPSDPSRNAVTDFRGFEEKTGKINGYGVLEWRLTKEEDRHHYDIKIEGEGRLYLQMNGAHPTLSKGEMRVKIVRAK